MLKQEWENFSRQHQMSADFPAVEARRPTRPPSSNARPLISSWSEPHGFTSVLTGRVLIVWPQTRPTVKWAVYRKTHSVLIYKDRMKCFNFFSWIDISGCWCFVFVLSCLATWHVWICAVFLIVLLMHFLLKQEAGAGHLRKAFFIVFLTIIVKWWSYLVLHLVFLLSVYVMFYLNNYITTTMHIMYRGHLFE